MRKVILEFLRCFRSIGIEPIVGGSFASSAWGKPRFTQDIDIMIVAGPQHEAEILALFQDEFALGPEEIHWARCETDPGRSFSMTSIESGFKVDVFVSDQTPFEFSEMERASTFELFKDVRARVSSAEDTALQKLRWFQMGNMVSDRQWNDIIQIIETQGENFDRDYFLKWAEDLGVLDLARMALAESRAS